MLLGNPRKTILLFDESDVRGRSVSFCLWKTDGRASKADRTRSFHSISGGSGVRLERPVRADPTPDGVKKRLNTCGLAGYTSARPVMMAIPAVLI